MGQYQDIKELLKPQRSIGASPTLRQRIHAATSQRRNTIATRWLWSAAAAACLMLTAGAAMLFNGKESIASSRGSECIVYVAGQKASADEALAIAEADVARMEHFMCAVAQQNAAEQEKVNQFMQHKSLEK